jgi:hypothetical protein
MQSLKLQKKMIDHNHYQENIFTNKKEFSIRIILNRKNM